MPATKVATCSYCGSRAALVLSGDQRHELTCSNCGAPLHDMKQFPSRPDRGDMRHASRKGSHGGKEMPKKRKQKKRKSLGQKFGEGLWDILEEVFD